MKLVMSPIKTVLRMPVKAGIAVLLVALGIYLGGGVSSLKNFTREAMTFLRASGGDEKFDPAILERPEKELAMIGSVDKGVQSKLKRARILIRKEQAQLAYMNEQCAFLQMQVRPVENDTRPPAQILSELAVAVQDGGVLSPEQRALYEGVGRSWISLKNRIQTTERSLQEIFTLSERVSFLQEKLEERRLDTLKFVPEQVPKDDKRRVVLASIEEAQGLLQEAHESLFKTVVTLNPELIKEPPRIAKSD